MSYTVHGGVSNICYAGFSPLTTDRGGTDEIMLCITLKFLASK